MDRLKWDETDFLEITEVVPVVEDYEVRHTYDFERCGICVRLDVRQLESFIFIKIMDKHESRVDIEMSFYCRSGAKVSNNSINFGDCVFVESRFTYIDKPEVMHKDKVPFGNDVILTISNDSVGICIK